MEKDSFPWAQNLATFPIDMAGHHSFSSSPDTNFYTESSNWDQTDPFESALSSMVSSPGASGNPAAGVQLIELIGKLGSICSPNEISPHFCIPSNNQNSCYSTPANSPPKLNLSTADQIRGQFPPLAPLAADPGFAERAARFSCFGSRSFNARTENSQLSVNDAEMANSLKLQRVTSCHFPGSQTNNLPDKLFESKEDSSISHKVESAEAIGRKRKSALRGKSKHIKPSKAGAESNDSDSKRAKSDENGKSAGEEKGQEDSKHPEPFKDYIHVRARRGQATDSHSLAERVRREKISKRMKFLQDLVPGCNKVTGKAVMLDEIINYVQSLQRQVEFLSMKLATVDPKMDNDQMEALLSKENLQAHASMYPVESSNSASVAFPYAYQSQEPPRQPNATSDSQFFCNTASQVSMWEDELHDVVQMGFAAGPMEQSPMKMEP